MDYQNSGKKFVYLVLFLVCSISLQAFATELKVPCNDGREEMKFFRDCNEFLVAGKPATSGEPAKPPLVKLLDNQVGTYVNVLYKNQLSLDTSVTTNSEQPGGIPIRGQVCSVLPNPFNKCSSEIDSSVVTDKSCGEFANIEVRFSGADWTGIITPKAPETSREIAYKNGAWVQAIAFFNEQVKKELITAKALKISAECKAMAEDIGNLASDASAQASSVEEQFTATDDRFKKSKNIGDIWNCMSNWTNRSSDTDQGPLRQSAQHLCSARSGLESGFTQLSLCEVFARATNAFRMKLSDVEAYKREMEEFNNAIRKTCEDRCSSKECGRNCPNPEYKTRYPEYIKQKIQDWSIPDCNPWNQASALPLFPFFAIGALRLKRSKRKNKIFTAILVAASMKLMVGCDSDGEIPNPISADYCPPDDTSSTLPLSCCENGVLKQELGEECSEPPINAIGGALVGGATALGAAQGSLDQSAALLSEGTETNLGPFNYADFGNSSAVSEDPNIQSKKSDPDKTKGPSIKKQARKRKFRGGVTLVSDSTSSMNLFGSKTSSFSPTPSPIPNESASDEDKELLYRTDSLADGSDTTGLTEAEGLEKTNENEIQLGKKTDGSLESIEDPDDYFSRIEIDESIFKKVERRYQTKATAWARETGLH